MRDVSTTCDIILPTSKKDLDLASSVPRRQLGRSVRIDRERLSTTAVASVMAATIPMHRAVPRATYRSRLSPRRRSCLVAELDKRQATFEARRHCGHSKALRRAIPPYEGRALPAWQPQRPNWVHGLADAKHPLGSMADCAPGARGSRRRPDREFYPTWATFLMLSRSRGTFAWVLAAPGALPTAGRSMDGPDGRTDGFPGGEGG